MNMQHAYQPDAGVRDLAVSATAEVAAAAMGVLKDVVVAATSRNKAAIGGSCTPLPRHVPFPLIWKDSRWHPCSP